jgi:hypothetical protein
MANTTHANKVSIAENIDVARVSKALRPNAA